MALNLKRKRATEDSSRKSRKVRGELNGSYGAPHRSDENDALSEEDEDERGSVDVEQEEGEGEWEGLDDKSNVNATVSHEPGTKPKKPPTGEELRVIQDATNLYRSSSFKLQIDALLPNVRPKDSRIPPLERFLLSLHTVLMGLPSFEPRHPLEASRLLLKKGVAVPYSAPLPTEETNWKVAFEKPSDITVVGSWPLKTSVKAKDEIRLGVDVAVEMPNDLFQEKDYLNGRFFHKRAFYLATIAAAVKSSKGGLNVDVQYESQSDDPRLTKLVLTPKKDNSPYDFTKLHAQVCIIPVLSSQSPVSIHKLSPSHSNIRINTINTTQNDPTKSPHLATPFYNTALLLALTPKAQLLATHALKENSPAFTDALTLLRVWANQRGYGPGSRLCVRGFADRGTWWSALLGLLIIGEERTSASKASKRKPLGRGLSSYQLFRGTLDFLSKHDFEKDPVFLKTKEGAHRFPPEEYQQHHEAVFVDSSSTVNLLAGVPLGSLQLLRHDALKTLEVLDHSSISVDPFTDVFLTDHRDLPTRFDTVMSVDLSSAKPLNSSLHSSLDFGSPANALMASLSSVLHRGLGDRTKVIAILNEPSLPRALSQAHPSNASTIYIGLIHNPSTAFRLVDHGPTADEEDASTIQRFRDFWGDKAELRRFKDGRIIESVVWDVKTADQRAHIPGMIVRHVLQRHFGLGSDAVQTWQTSFDSLLRLPEVISTKYISAGILTGFKGAITAYDTLVKQIKGLDNALPLSVLNVSPISEQLRYTSVHSPVPLPTSLSSIFPATAQYLSPIHIILEFENSSRWPDDLKAIQKTKLAFFERIASELISSNTGLRAAVVVGDGIHTSEILDQATLEVVTPEGWAFLISIWNEREAILLDRIIEDYDKPIPPALRALQEAGQNGKDPKQYREALEAKEVYTRRFIHSPRHHRAVSSLCHQYSAFGGTVRLVKRWLAAHWLLHGHISEEAVELICASFFVGDGMNIGLDIDGDANRDDSASVPGSKERGFSIVIAFLKDWKWEEGLFVPLYGPNKVSEDGSSKVTPRATSGGVWSITTDFDKEGRMWTSNGPDLVVAHRVRALAQATWQYLQGMEQGKFNVQVTQRLLFSVLVHRVSQAMFVHPTSDYDFIVRLDATQLPRYFHNVAVDLDLLSRGKYANLQDNQSVRPGFDPAGLLFHDLQRIYGHTFKIFYDTFGGDRFGVVWDPSLKESRPFRVLGEFSSLPVKKENEKAKDKGLVVLNEGAVLSEIERLGSSLVQEITVHISS
ncbi:hypothetical protein C0993_012058 [Termitomyces sp. T159_Od127]|nr:hypothetical protein C0993_012058 [Termitomyces sp. T159_Od127]